VDERGPSGRERGVDTRSTPATGASPRTRPAGSVGARRGPHAGHARDGWGSRTVPGPRERTPGRTPATARPVRPAAATPARRQRTLRERARIASVVSSALVLLLTGAAWGLYRDVTAGITTTDITGGGDGGDQHILLVGVDSRTDAQGRPLPPEVLARLHSGPDTGVLNSDTIILLHVPEDGGRATAFSIPRDAYVDVPGLGPDKINAAYPVTKAAVAERLVAGGMRDRARIEAESSQAGRTALVQAVQRLTGVTVDHYAELNLLGFHELTTAIGGVEVCLRGPVDDALSGARFATGPQTVAGAEALAFVRQRHGLPDGDLSRIRRQQAFLAAVADKILSAGTLTDPAALGGLVDVAQRSLVIDEGWDLLAFARQAAGLAAGDIEFVTIPTEGPATNAAGDVVLVDRSAVRDFVQRRAEAPPHAEGEVEPVAAPAPPPVEVPAGRYIVHVGNGTPTSGLAARVAAVLGEAGFRRGTVGNADAAQTSVVRHSGDKDAAQAVADRLGGLTVEEDGSIAPGHLEVVIGRDFAPAPDLLPAPPPEPAPAETRPDAAITASGVPCVD